MRSSVLKHSVVIAGHRTSISLEDIFWSELRDIALGRGATLSNIVAEIKTELGDGNLSSAIRVFVLNRARAHARVPKFAGSAVQQPGMNGAGAKNRV